jgi:hypothetical protein
MSIVIANCKGYTHVIDDENNAAGFYDIEPKFEDSAGAKTLIMGVTLGFSEIIQPTTTLDDKRLIYMFGTAWNDLSITGLLLLGDHSTKGEILSKLAQWYEANRISKRGDNPVSVSLGTFGVSAYVTGMSLGLANPNTNTQPFTIQLITADVKP